MKPAEINKGNMLISELIGIPFNQCAAHRNWNQLITAYNKVLELSDSFLHLKDLPDWHFYSAIFNSMFRVSDVNSQMNIDSNFLMLTDFIAYIRKYTPFWPSKKKSA